MSYIGIRWLSVLFEGKKNFKKKNPNLEDLSHAFLSRSDP